MKAIILHNAEPVIPDTIDQKNDHGDIRIDGTQAGKEFLFNIEKMITARKGTKLYTIREADYENGLAVRRLRVIFPVTIISLGSDVLYVYESLEQIQSLINS